MAPSRTSAALVVLLMACGEAEIHTRRASGFNRKDRELQGAESMWNGTLQSAALCLSACTKLDCRSLTFGKRECNLYSTYLCHPQDRFHLSLVDSPGITYFDLHSDLHNTLVISKKEACLRYGRCLEKCEEGPWVTSTTTTSRTTTTSTTKPPSKDEKGGNGGTFQNAVDLEHGSTSNVSEMQITAPSIDNGVTPLNQRLLGSSDKNEEVKGSRSTVSTESIADNTATVRTSPGPTRPPEKLGSGLLLIQTPMNFNEALEHCTKANMSLAMPRSKREHAILVGAMKRRGIARMWIGVKKISASGRDATYVDGRAVSRQLLLWGEGQPNNSRGGQICVEMNAILKYLWNDFDCLYRTAFVCR